MSTLTTFFITLASAVVGGIIAGYYSFKATKEAHQNQKKVADENEKLIIKSLLQAIHDELETVFDRYQETMGSKIESLEKNTPLMMYYPLVSDFFTVYNGNSFLIGRIKDNDLRKSIIKTYTLAKGMVDSFRMNNDILQKYEHWSFVYAETKEDIHRDRINAYYLSLVNYADTLRSIHNDLKVNLKMTTRTLIKNGVLSEAI
ncbi:hypothetical protein [Yersinia rochesterensis]|uniref:hypothetical protein n=1 Tax=Yersinia rochesterensis TaxID=1604335 RepID=UPI0011A2F29E|nr:hypothetical protein [Yersinia rochesterensis]